MFAPLTPRVSLSLTGVFTGAVVLAALVGSGGCALEPLALACESGSDCASGVCVRDMCRAPGFVDDVVDTSARLRPPLDPFDLGGDDGAASGDDGVRGAPHEADLPRDPVASDPGGPGDPTGPANLVCLDAEHCFLDIGAIAHGFPQLAAPTSIDDARVDAHFDDVALACDGEVIVDTDAIGTNSDTAGAATASLCGRAVSVIESNGRLVFSMRNLALTSGTLRFTGAKNVAFAVYGDVVVAAGARLSVDALASADGSGIRVCEAQNGAVDDGGGAGGSHGTRGGDGGTNLGGDVGGLAGDAELASIHDVLERGCRGGWANATVTGGGGAGGALQLSAGGGVIVHGVVSANGGGGASDQTGGAAGGGGGSGGDLYVQAARLVVDGALLAQGGGGGAGNDATGTNGEDGSLDPATCAHGATSAVSTGGMGAGGAADGALDDALAGTAAVSGAGSGGGGGGVGRIGAALLESDACTLVSTTNASPPLDCR